MGAGYVAVGIAVAVLFYNSWSKASPVLGPVNMGLCRGLNLGLGMAIVPGTLALKLPWLLIEIAPVLRISSHALATASRIA